MLIWNNLWLFDFCKAIDMHFPGQVITGMMYLKILYHNSIYYSIGFTESALKVWQQISKSGGGTF